MGLSGVVALSGGDQHGLALKSDGTVWAWGDNSGGELGNGTFTSSPPWGIATPAPVTGLTGVSAVAGGFFHSLAAQSDGTVWVWGDNYYGELGNGMFTSSPPYGIATPAPVTGLAGAVAVAAGNDHSLVLKSDGTVWAWGYNAHGELGNGATTPNAPYGVATPAPVTGLTDVVAVAGGGDHSLALKSDGTVWAWGYNAHGELGNGTFTDSATPVKVTGLTGVIAIAAGHSHSLALKSDGTLRTWGDNSGGELGNGTFTDSATPVKVPGLTGVIAIAAGGNSLALEPDGTLWDWGANRYGELGIGTFTSDPPGGIATPAQVPGLTSIIAVAGGGAYSLALVSTSLTVTVSGVVTLRGCLNPVQPLTFTFRNPAAGRAPFARTATLAADGSFSLTDIPAGYYTLHVKGSKWLAKNLTLNATHGDVLGLSLTLSPGDINDDNKVSITDLGLLADSFGKGQGQTGYNANADLDCNNKVTIADLGLLADSFGKSGDP
jgi:alpha-tubulin suppressor-like RCC1 family protein